MLSIDLRSRTPIYEQVKNQIIELIRVGVYKPNDQLPSIRAASADAGLNVNTVKRAFSDLEADGVIYTVIGRGSFVSENALAGEGMRQKALDGVAEAVNAARMKGIEKREITDLVEKMYGKEDKNG